MVRQYYFTEASQLDEPLSQRMLRLLEPPAAKYPRSSSCPKPSSHLGYLPRNHLSVWPIALRNASRKPVVENRCPVILKSRMARFPKFKP